MGDHRRDGDGGEDVFFQAEDGIRDVAVTGVQTCALPILSVDGGATYKSVAIETRKTAGQDGPSVRPAIAADNTVYAAFFGWRKFNGTVATSDVEIGRASCRERV